MDSAVAGFWGAIIGGLIAGGASILTAKMMLKEQRFDAAAIRFRYLVLNELKDCYTIDLFEESEQIYNLSDTRPQVITAAAEFRFFVQDKKAFDEAIFNYNVFCKDIITNETMRHEVYKNLCGNSVVMYKEKFKGIVDHLLSFTEKTNTPFFIHAASIQLFVPKLVNKIKRYCG